MPHPANAFMTSRFSRPPVQRSISAVNAAPFLERAGGVAKRSSVRKSGRPMTSVIASNISGLSGGMVM